MAIITENFNANGSITEFTIATNILSESHVRVDYLYDGIDHHISSNNWDIMTSTIIFHTAPDNGYVVRITVSTDGEGLDTAPSENSDVALHLDDVISCSENMDSIINASDNIGIVNSLTVDADTVDYQSTATATLTDEHIQFEIPQGMSGVNGVDGMTPVYEVAQDEYEIVFNLTGYIPSTDILAEEV